MGVIADILTMLNAKMTRPELYGWFHIMWLVITIAATTVLCIRYRKNAEKFAPRIVLVVAVTVTLLEIYKQINYTFSVSDTGAICADFQWYAFPFQFCSMPMYVGLLTALFRKGKIHDALYAFLATYAVFAGVCVMLYPQDVFIETIGINIQTMICHGSMIVVGAYLLYSGYVKIEHRTLLKAVPVFAVAVALAAVMNEVAHLTDLLQTETFNMFFISPHCDPSLPVYSLVQQVVPFPWCLVIYIAAFTLAAYVILLLALLIKNLHRNKLKTNSTVS